MNNIKNLGATRRVHILFTGGNRIRIAHAVCLPKCLLFDCWLPKEELSRQHAFFIALLRQTTCTAGR